MHIYTDKTVSCHYWLAYGQSKTANILFTVYISLHLASTGIVSDSTNIYLSCCQFANVAPHAVDLDAAQRLFELSEKLVGNKFPL